DPQTLDEDLQIMRATLATITDDIHRLSPTAGRALDEAKAKLDEAHAEFVRPPHETPLLGGD
ncbi:MAG TPA: hypothetical protein VGD81_02465, partial [Opitutaceae bacterium]